MSKNMLHGGNEGFTCQHCKKEVLPASNGQKRNHCPFCIHSLHVDEDVPGDRAATCKGSMEPKDFEQKRGEWRVLHQCKRCGKLSWNRLNLDDNQPDDLNFVQKLMSSRAFRG